MDVGHPQQFEIKDGDRILRFTGYLLGEASSHRPGKSRWAEIKIHRTEAGKYIVSGVGRSILPGEHDKWWATVCERPEGVLEKLHMLDGDHSKYLPMVSKKAIEQARAEDDVFAAAYLLEEIA